MKTGIVATGGAAIAGLVVGFGLNEISHRDSFLREQADNSVRILGSSSDPNVNAYAAANDVHPTLGFVSNGGVVTRSTIEVPSDIWPDAPCVTYGCIQYRADLRNEVPNMIILKPLHAGEHAPQNPAELAFAAMFGDPSLPSREVILAGRFKVVKNEKSEFVAQGSIPSGS